MGNALTEAEIERLAARLSANKDHSLSLEWVDGLFCALIASPTLASASLHIPLILGGEYSECEAFVGFEDPEDMPWLLMRYWDGILHDFQSERLMHTPYIREPWTDQVPGRDWARGYMQGTRSAPEGWIRLFEEKSEWLVLTIPLVAGEIEPDWRHDPQSAEPSDELLLRMLAGAAARAYRCFEPRRRDFAEREPLSLLCAADAKDHVH